MNEKRNLSRGALFNRIYDADIGQREKLILFGILRYTNANNPKPYRPLRSLVRELKMNAHTIVRLLHELQAAGLIEVEQEKGERGRWGKKRYIINFPKLSNRYPPTGTGQKDPVNRMLTTACGERHPVTGCSRPDAHDRMRSEASKKETTEIETVETEPASAVSVSYLNGAATATATAAKKRLKMSELKEEMTDEMIADNSWDTNQLIESILEGEN